VGRTVGAAWQPPSVNLDNLHVVPKAALGDSWASSPRPSSRGKCRCPRLCARLGGAERALRTARPAGSWRRTEVPASSPSSAHSSRDSRTGRLRTSPATATSSWVPGLDLPASGVRERGGATFATVRRATARRPARPPRRPRARGAEAPGGRSGVIARTSPSRGVTMPDAALLARPPQAGEGRRGASGRPTLAAHPRELGRVAARPPRRSTRDEALGGPEEPA